MDCTGEDISLWIEANPDDKIKKRRQNSFYKMFSEYQKKRWVHCTSVFFLTLISVS